MLPGRPIAMLSGPSFAEEAVRGLPTAVSIATCDPALGRRWPTSLAAGAFRPYWTHDVLGVALGGAVKNVLAIAAGIVEGRGLGHNAAAALVTRGFAEMARLGQAMGAELETLTGLSGLGDLVLTCHGPLSRNRSLGVALGKGTPLADYMQGRRQVVEGEATAPAVLARAARQRIEMPICAAVDAILHERRGPRRGDPRACWRVRCGAKGNEDRGVTWRIGSSSPSRRPIRGTSLVKDKKHRRGPACATPRPRSTSRR